MYSLTIGPFQIPIMLMSYLGALKAWIYSPIFAVFGPGVRSIREPMLVAGAASIWLFFLLLRRIACDRTALIGCTILAADSIYLLTTVYDWGPVALQHLLLLGGVYLLVRFYQTMSRVSLAGGAFLLGLVMWDKALAIWMLSGIFIAAMLTFPRRILAVTGKKSLLTFGAFFAFGALPLLIYNLDNRFATFLGNVQRDPAGLAGKARFLVASAEGHGLFGWMTFEDWQTKNPHQPETSLARTSARISELAGQPRHNLLLYAFLLALVLAPFGGWYTVRLVLFSLIALAVAWFQMAINANTGGSIHHTVLLWPLPQFTVAVVFGAVSRRLGRAGAPVLAVAGVAMVLSGMLVINEYYTVALRNGGGQAWTDGINNLSEYLKKVPAKNVLCMDWGMLDQLRVLHKGRIPVGMAIDQVGKPQMDEQDRAIVDKMIADPENIFLAHTKDFEFFPGHSTKMIEYAHQSGFERDLLQVVRDNYGRDVYEVYRFRKPASGN